MPLLSKPTGKSNVRYFNPAYGQDVYLITVEEATISLKEKVINLYGKCSLKNILNEAALIAWNINSDTYKGKSYSEGELVEVDVNPEIAEVSLFTELRNLLGDKEKVGIKGTISIGIQSSEVQLEVSEAKANNSKGGYKSNCTPESFYENTKAVLEARRDFYLGELSQAIKALGIELEIKSLFDVIELTEKVKSDSNLSIKLGTISSLIKSFWINEK
ncbi:hypothetical protein [Synechococcus sp. PCC 6312]|uniref:hypothetical protein n=1 Tax=Synechococcus sp. (strain ATCC 27167 / PCC 6312) TaxID=195253 RepID=UPI00029ECAE7|nr:hypothetical protein [Synechococcus sp. PCC 6312]AFY60535.1 hypothetical protein Syn6312_1364 [Synechococcus sp. PCC 6312]